MVGVNLNVASSPRYGLALFSKIILPRDIKPLKKEYAVCFVTAKSVVEGASGGVKNVRTTEKVSSQFIRIVRIEK